MAIAQSETLSKLEQVWIAMDAVVVALIAFGNIQLILYPALGMFSRDVFRTWREGFGRDEDNKLKRQLPTQ